VRRYNSPNHCDTLGPDRLAQLRVVAERVDDLGRSLLLLKKPPDESLRVLSKSIGLTLRRVAQRLGVPQADRLVARAGGQGLAVGAMRLPSGLTASHRPSGL
jgi:hypothetical protein